MSKKRNKLIQGVKQMDKIKFIFTCTWYRNDPIDFIPCIRIRHNFRYGWGEAYFSWLKLLVGLSWYRDEKVDCVTSILWNPASRNNCDHVWDYDGGYCNKCGRWIYDKEVK